MAEADPTSESEIDPTDQAPDAPGIESGTRSALLIDWGGVLTTNLFASFHAYCVEVGIDPQTLMGRFKSDPEARELLVALEKGELDEREFEVQFAAPARGRPRGPDRRAVRRRAAG